MCFAHSGTASDALHVQAEIGASAAAAFTELAAAGGLGTLKVAGSGIPGAVAAPDGERVLGGCTRVIHNRWNRGRHHDHRPGPDPPAHRPGRGGGRRVTSSGWRSWT